MEWLVLLVLVGSLIVVWVYWPRKRRRRKREEAEFEAPDFELSPASGGARLASAKSGKGARVDDDRSDGGDGGSDGGGDGGGGGGGD